MNVPLYLTIAVMYTWQYHPACGRTNKETESRTVHARSESSCTGQPGSWFFHSNPCNCSWCSWLLSRCSLNTCHICSWLDFGTNSVCMQFVHLCGMLGVKPKTASNLIILLPAVVSALTYSYTAVLNERSRVSVFRLLTALSLAPPFSFSMFCTNLLLLNNEEDGGMTFNNFYDNTRAGISPANSLLGIYLGTMVMLLFNIYKMIKSTGIVFTFSSDQDVTPDMSNSREAVKIQNLHKHYNLGGGRTTRAVNGLTCSFYSDAINVFLGSNGSEKSTTISVLTGLYSRLRVMPDWRWASSLTWNSCCKICVCSQENVCGIFLQYVSMQVFVHTKCSKL